MLGPARAVGAGSLRPRAPYVLQSLKPGQGSVGQLCEGLVSASLQEDTYGMHPPTSAIVRWLAAGDAGEFETFDSLLHPDVVVHAPGGLSTSSRAEEVNVWMAAIEAIPDLRHEIQELLIADDVEMARVVVTGTMKKNFGGVVAREQEVRLDQAVIVHLRDGRITEAWEIVNLTELSH